MTKNQCCKLLICCVLSFTVLMSEGHAQNKDQVLFDDYTHAQADFLHLLKKDGGISKFTSMSSLKTNVKNVRENSIVPVNIIKAGKRLIAPADMVKKRKESVLVIWKYIPATVQPEKVSTFATAIVLSEDGVCATNYHVFRNMIDSAYKLYPTDSIMFVSTASGKLYPITSILSYNQTADMALFKIDTGNDKLSAFPVGEDLPAGSNVNTLTNPEGYLYFYSRGVVARNIITSAGNPFSHRTEITADYAKGSSGGPIFDDCGNLVAMVSTTNSIYYMERPQTNLQMVVKQTIPISSIRKMIQ